MCNELIIEPTEQINKSLDSAEIVELSESKSNESGEQQEENCGEPELSVHAQYILLEALNNLKKILGEMAQEHKHPIHHLISRCGDPDPGKSGSMVWAWILFLRVWAVS
uniref:Uncharacterized protein n=1 Tax=Meloidogyne incognita TaxID=6306 RepID=A0A914MKE9_MELIC